MYLFPSPPGSDNLPATRGTIGVLGLAYLQQVRWEHQNLNLPTQVAV